MKDIPSAPVYERPEKSPGSGEEFAQHLRNTLPPARPPISDEVRASNQELGFVPRDPAKAGHIPVKRFLTE